MKPEVPNIFVRKLVDEIKRESTLLKIIRANTPPPTRWMRFKIRILIRWWRVRDAWAVLIGKAQAEYD